MRVQKIESELDRVGWRVMNLPEFCARYKIGRSKAYQEIKAKRLKAHKCGDRTIITDNDAEEWLHSLPVFGENAQKARARRKRVS
ncbi:MAG TPA: DNA-binding protein [Xanthobacteraceae bacterium]|nr:DNA-binding protein [Xanthobacteraceae bacterium]